MFTKVNEALERAGEVPLFKVELIGLSRETTLSNGLFTIKPQLDIRDTFKTDLVIIPAVHGDIAKILTANRDFIPWIINQHQAGAEVVSLCIGAFILAATGC